MLYLLHRSTLLKHSAKCLRSWENFYVRRTWTQIPSTQAEWNRVQIEALCLSNYLIRMSRGTLSANPDTGCSTRTVALSEYHLHLWAQRLYSYHFGTCIYLVFTIRLKSFLLKNKQWKCLEGIIIWGVGWNPKPTNLTIFQVGKVWFPFQWI